MRHRILFAALFAAILALTSGANAAPAREADGTPGTCDGKTLSHHIHRAHVIIKDGYSTDRIPDLSPMTHSEKRSLRTHKFCVQLPDKRDGIAKFRDKHAAKYDRALGKAAPWLSKQGRALVRQYAGTLASIRSCESGGDYTVVDSSGTYFGAYQFDMGTWASVGGSGAPNVASPAEQDYRAALLYSRAGSSPWPVCG